MNILAVAEPGSNVESVASDVTPAAGTLRIEGVNVQYGGVLALSNVSLTLRSGGIFGLIGPNGAGKTTMINVITGITQPQRGRVILGGSDVSDWPVHQRARAGLARTFQNLALFASMSVRENIACGAVATIRASKYKAAASVDRVIQRLGLEALQHEPVGVLSLGARKRVEFARALVGLPSLLLLDEPAAGLAEDEIAELAKLIRELADAGTSILLVEHDMSLVMSLCHHIFVLDFGKLIAEGTTAEVQSNAVVQAAYFGQSHDEH
jgi:branched-chain amino acid transport system ATP-binding protein